MTFNCDLDLGCGNLNFVHYTPSHSVYLSVKLWPFELQLTHDFV